MASFAALFGCIRDVVDGKLATPLESGSNAPRGIVHPDWDLPTGMETKIPMTRNERQCLGNLHGFTKERRDIYKYNIQAPSSGQKSWWSRWLSYFEEAPRYRGVFGHSREVARWTLAKARKRWGFSQDRSIFIGYAGSWNMILTAAFCKTGELIPLSE